MKESYKTLDDGYTVYSLDYSKSSWKKVWAWCGVAMFFLAVGLFFYAGLCGCQLILGNVFHTII